MGQKLKVVWLCYFTNKQVQELIKPLKTINEFAPWITDLIHVFEYNTDVELHIVSEHRWIRGIKKITHKGIHYHFYNRGIPLIGRHWPGFFRFDIYTKFYFLKRTVAKIIYRINPDIIHVHGTENEFCQSVLQFYNKFPVLITIQGFISKSSDTGKVINLRKNTELNLIRRFKHFGYRTSTMGEEILSINPEANLHWHRYPIKKIKPIICEKKFDLVFFARISKDKGIVDLLKAMALLIEKKHDISLCVIGGGKYSEFIDLAKDLNIAENIKWVGFLPTQDDVHQLACQAKVSVLPTYFDIIPGTIIESMFLKIPVVAYNVGSIHELNKNDLVISIVEKGDIMNLSAAIIQLLENEKYRTEMAEKAYQRASEMFTTDQTQIRTELLTAYNKVIQSQSFN